jgi:hypothetical protein
MSESKFSLIDLSALSEPACKLIEAVSQCIGTLYEPRRIRKKAKAKADATLILAKADAERQALLNRAAYRLAIQEVRRQQNIENIIKIAASSLPEKVSEEPVDPDWISRFFDECKDVSENELQELWGRILAGEVASPKSCSRKTLAILKDLSREDAELFTTFCSYVWVRIGDFFDGDLRYYEPYYFMPIDPIDLERFLEKCILTYGECLHLENLGLIHCKKDISINLSVHDILIYSNLYHSIVWDYKYKYNSYIDSDDWGRIDCFVLTKAGIELLSVAKVEPNWNYYFDSCKYLTENYEVFLSCPMDKNIKLSI